MKISIVGETGCGKTTTVYTIAQILARQARVDQGEVYFQGENVLKMDKRELKKLREKGISIIFQDPIASLNPVFTVGNQMKEIVSYSGIEGARINACKPKEPSPHYERRSFRTLSGLWTAIPSSCRAV